ncbi:MAG: sigma-70 family RNA polymerase sigma factor [Planctomycetes bacterium]|nr:sigma-70 family RNA polymerase sigma factor [Planctomycetota bacterium]
MADLTRILRDSRAGRTGAAEELAVLLYDELRALARQELAGERPAHTLQPTALVHEAYLRLVGKDGAAFESRAHFFGAAATAIRRVLVDHARRRARAKRGGGVAQLSLEELNPLQPISDAELLGLDEVLARLSVLDPIKAQIVELRFFAGMTVEELARALELSESTVRRHWRVARAWLRGELARGT